MNLSFHSRLCILFVMLLTAPGVSEAQKGTPPFGAMLARAERDTDKLNVYRRIFAYYKDSHVDSARAYLEVGLEDFKRSGYHYGKAALTGMLSGIYSTLGKSQEAKETAVTTLQLFTEIGDEAGIAKAQNNLGVILGKMGQVPEAVKHFLDALHYFERIADTPGIVNSYIKLGMANDISGNKDKALTYYLNGLDLSLRSGETANTAYLYNNIGSAYAARHDYDRALSYLQKGLKLAENPRYAEARISPLMNIGNIYAEQKVFDKALEYYDQALKLARSLNNREQEAQLLHALGVAEAQLNSKGDTAIGDALAMARQAGNRPLQVKILKDLALVAHSKGDYKEEVRLMRMERRLSDSLFNLEKATEIASLQSQHELKKSNTELAALKVSELKNREQKQLIILIAAILGATLIAMVLFLVRSTMLNRKLKVREQELQKANTVKDRLFAIIGHDLRGPVSNIPALLQIYKDEDTDQEEKTFILNGLEENAGALLNTLEKLLHWGNLQIKGNTINKSVVHVSDTADDVVRLLRMSAEQKDIALVNKIPEHIRVYADENHLKFILRNLVNNAVKFTGYGGRIEINAKKQGEDNSYLFSVKDNGMGIEQKKQAHIFEPYNVSTAGTASETGTSMGLMLCKEFVEQNGGKIWVESEKDKGSVFYFTVKGAVTEAEVPLAAN